VLLLTSTTTGIRLVAIWKQKLDGWYIVAAGESDDEKEKNLKNVIDKLIPRQFQDAVEKGWYSFA
jgi:hypothetical protein